MKAALQGHLDEHAPWRAVVVTCLAIGGVLLVLADLTPLRVAGLAALVAITGAAWNTRTGGATNGTLALAVGVALLVLSDVGIPSASDGSGGWQMLVVLLAYPCIGLACIEHVERYLRIRESDLIVEAALLGAAAAMVVQGVIEWRLSGPPRGWWSPAGSQAIVLVGLDVVLFVIAARALAVESARRAPISLIAGAAASLLLIHAGIALRMADGASLSVLGLVAAIPLVVLALAGALDALVETPDRIGHDVHRFSPSHAAVVGASVLVGPAVLCFQVATDLYVSATVAMGAAASAVVLAWHLIALLRERAVSEHQATHDPLTDLPNRVLLLDRLERALAHAQRAGTPVGVLYLDLDQFKDVNDTLGHEAGDHLLAVAARRLVGCARNEDTVARIAGDEFAVLLPHLRHADDVLLVAERIVDALSEPATLDGHRVRCPGSVGVAVYPDDGHTAPELLAAADAAMYRAKDHGGSGVGVFNSEMYRHASTRIEIENALVQALERDEFVLHYQPIVDAADGRIVGAEALVRWQHPTRGLVGPADFIPVAEQSELIDRIGSEVLRKACAELTRWAVAGAADVFVSVNVSGKQFQRDLVSDVTAALRETGVDPSGLVLELTETTAIDDVNGVADRLRELRSLGVRAAIDDFGTGYCGLQYLGDLPVSTLKLDKSFVQSMTSNTMAIIAATIAMAHSLGLTLVAEGVETDEQRQFLERSGCDRLQGFHLGRPMPAADLLPLLLADRPVEESDEHGPGPVDRSPWEGVAVR